jgi:hypothetical protein
MLIAGSGGFLTPYGGADIPCEMPDFPYVASVVASDFVALCCYDCALYHAHSCSRIRFPSCDRVPYGALPANADESSEHAVGFGDETNAIAAANAASLTFGTLPDFQRLRVSKTSNPSILVPKPAYEPPYLDFLLLSKPNREL